METATFQTEGLFDSDGAPTGYFAWGHIAPDRMIARSIAEWDSDYDEKIPSSKWTVEHSYAKEPTVEELERDEFFGFQASRKPKKGYEPITFCRVPEVAG